MSASAYSQVGQYFFYETSGEYRQTESAGICQGLDLDWVDVDSTDVATALIASTLGWC